MTLLKLSGDDGKELGMFNWFAVHPTSMNNTNVLVSGDNKGIEAWVGEWVRVASMGGLRVGLREVCSRWGRWVW